MWGIFTNKLTRRHRPTDKQEDVFIETATIILIKDRKKNKPCVTENSVDLCDLRMTLKQKKKGDLLAAKQYILEKKIIRKETRESNRNRPRCSLVQYTLPPLPRMNVSGFWVVSGGLVQIRCHTFNGLPQVGCGYTCSLSPPVCDSSVNESWEQCEGLWVIEKRYINLI